MVPPTNLVETWRRRCSVHTALRRRDSTQQLSRVGSVLWALEFYKTTELSRHVKNHYTAILFTVVKCVIDAPISGRCVQLMPKLLGSNE